MARLFIGADIDEQSLRVVCLEATRQGEVVRAVARRSIDDAAAAVAELAALVNEWEAQGAHIACALPDDRLLTRMLTFPFADRRKINAAAPLALAAQLPGDLEGYLTSVMPPVKQAEGVRCLATALPEAEVEAFLAPFDATHLPLRVLDQQPFAALAGRRTADDDGILVLVRTRACGLVRFVAGAPVDYLQLRLPESAEAAELAATIAAGVHSLPGSWPPGEAGVLLAGAALTPELQRAIIAELPEARVPEVSWEQGRLSAEFLPAFWLARRALLPSRRAGSNLRQGKFAYRGNLAPHRRPLWASGVLLALALVAAIAASWIGYAGKRATYNRLQQELVKIYQQSVPGAPPVADIPLYLESRLQTLQTQARQLGSAAQKPLPVLAALSRAMGDNPALAISEWNFDADGVTIAGQAGSFDDVDQLAARLGDEVLFASVQIADAKTTLDGNRVDYRIAMQFAAGKEGK